MSYIEDLFSLKGSTAVVTGAASGLGLQCAQVLAKAGAQLALFDVNADGLRDTAKLIEQAGCQALAVPVDVRREQQVEAGIRQVIDALGPIHILVNCAGVILVKPALDNTEEDWNRVFDINLKGTWFMCQTVLRHMVREKIQGSVINISSADSHRTQPDMTVYSSSKAAINHLTRSLSYEMAPYRIRVNTLAPGGMLTSMVKEFLQTPDGQNAVWTVPFRRFANLDELDGALLLLASRASSYMTGSVVTVDGGLSCNALQYRDS